MEFHLENNYEKNIFKTSAGFYNVNLSRAKLILDSGEFFVLDVRPHSLFSDSHLKGAVNISVIDLPDRIGEIPVNSKILIYCQFDIMSRSAAEKLAKAGFDEVYNILGGFGAWCRAGYDFVSDI
jgi:rhodanese-related sulfurtransferase